MTVSGAGLPGRGEKGARQAVAPDGGKELRHPAGEAGPGNDLNST